MLNLRPPHGSKERENLTGPTPIALLTAARRGGGSRARRTGAGALAAAAVVAVALSGCGGSSNAATSSTANVTAEKARAQFTTCMQQHGVNIRTQAGPNGGGIQVQVRVDKNTAAFQAAQRACQKYLRGAFGNITPAQKAQFRQAMVKFTACLRQHGQNVPDPTFNGDGAPGAAPPTTARPGGGSSNGPRTDFGGVDRNTPAFQAAAKACQSNLPKPPGGGVRFGVGGPGGGPPGGKPGG
jgi:hypothetical protein